MPSPGVPEANTLPLSFKSTHDTDGLAGYPALDWFRPAGTIVGAPAQGTILSVRPSSGSGTVYGTHVHMRTTTGREIFMTHFGQTFVRAGQPVDRGAPLGRVAPYGDASHIHFAVKQGGPEVGATVDLGDGGNRTSGRDYAGGTMTREEAIEEATRRATDKVASGPSIGSIVGKVSSLDDALSAVFSWRGAEVLGGGLLVILGLLILGRRLGMAALPMPAMAAKAARVA